MKKKMKTMKEKRTRCQVSVPQTLTQEVKQGLVLSLDRKSVV